MTDGGWTLARDDQDGLLPGCYRLMHGGSTAYSVDIPRCAEGCVSIEDWSVKGSDVGVFVDLEALPVLIEALQKIQAERMVRLRGKGQTSGETV